jgi:protocatechuate 3,4-dioxygenase beta subunit
MAREPGMTGSGVTRRALVIAAPMLLISTAVPAAVAPTPRAGEGPFYPVRIPADNDADLVRVEGAVRQAGGEILHLAGHVLDTNARPIAGARVEIWQCDANGVYLHPGDRRSGARDKGFQGFGHADADSGGRFAFRTIVPVSYPGRTPHIHVKIIGDGRDLLTTQVYRQGHPQNSSDFLFRNMSQREQRRVSMAIRPRAASPRRTFETDIDLVVAR